MGAILNRLSLAVIGRSCIISVDAIPRILGDPGSGMLATGLQTFEFSSLEQILLTRLEVGCTADLAAVLLHLYARGRKRPIALTGPDGRPGTDEFVQLLLGPEGAWRYVNAVGGFGITVRQTPSAVSDLAVYSIPVDPVLDELDVTLYGVAVAGGPLPAVAFRVECEDESIVLAGDVAHLTPSFAALAADCGTLVVGGSHEATTIDELGAKCRAKLVLTV